MAKVKSGAAASARIAAASMWLVTEALGRHSDTGFVSEVEEDLATEVLRIAQEGHEGLDETIAASDRSDWTTWVHKMMAQLAATADGCRDVLAEMLELRHEQGHKPPPDLTAAYLAANQAYNAVVLYTRSGEQTEDSPSDEEIQQWMKEADDDG